MKDDDQINREEHAETMRKGYTPVLPLGSLKFTEENVAALHRLFERYAYTDTRTDNTRDQVLEHTGIDVLASHFSKEDSKEIAAEMLKHAGLRPHDVNAVLIKVWGAGLS